MMARSWLLVFWPRRSPEISMNSRTKKFRTGEAASLAGSPTEAQIRHLMTLVGAIRPCFVVFWQPRMQRFLVLNLALLQAGLQKILDPILSPLKKTPDLLAALQLLVGQRGQPIKAEQAVGLQLMGLIRATRLVATESATNFLESYLSTRNNG